MTFVVNLLLEREALPEKTLKTESKKDGTGEGTRTPTLVKEADFESAASTNSATPAPGGCTLIFGVGGVNKFVSANTFSPASFCVCPIALQIQIHSRCWIR